MSTKTEKVWVIVMKNAGVVYNTNARTRTRCVLDYVYGRNNQNKWASWKRLRADGYRCVRATLTWEVPDER